MITRRAAIVLFPGSVLATTSFANFAMAETAVGPIDQHFSTTERGWLACALGHLVRIDRNRAVALLKNQAIDYSPGNTAYCTFEFADRDIYVQFIADHDIRRLTCYATSSEMFKIPPLINKKLLHEYGFKVEVEEFRNYERDIEINSDDDLRFAADLAFRTLKYAYGVTDFTSAQFQLNLPDAA